MPTLEQAIQPMDMDKLGTEPIVSLSSSVVSNISLPVQAISNYLYSPLPAVKAFPDNLRQFYRDNIPQYRLLPASTLY